MDQIVQYNFNNVKTLLKRLWTSAALIIILFALIFSLFRGLTPWVSQYRPELEQRVSNILGEPVHIASMTTGWYWFAPIVKLKDIELSSTTGQPLRLGQLFVGLNIFSSLRNWRWQPGMLVIEDLQITLLQTKQGWDVQGLHNSAAGINTKNAQQFTWLMQWLFTQQKLRLRNANIRLILLDGAVVPLDKVSLLVQNHDGHYLIKGEALMPQASGSKFSLQGSLDIDEGNVKRAKGRLFVGVENFVPGQLQSLFLPAHLNVVSGEASGQFWFDIDKGHVTHGQAVLHAENLIIENPNKNKQAFLQTLAANVSWDISEGVFHLLADNIKARLNSVQWPENQLRLAYYSASKTIDMTVRHTDASIVHTLAVLSADDSFPFADMALSGSIKHLHARWNQQSLQSLFAKFNALSWRGHHRLPNVSNLSGAVSIDNHVGKLRLDSNEVLLQFAQKPALLLNTIAANVHWKQEKSGLRNLTIKELSLMHVNLELSMQGSLSKSAPTAAPDINLHGRMSLANAEFWKPFLPKNYLKPKVYDWLNQDVTTVPRATVSFDVAGNWNDFPFDSAPGQFHVEVVGEDVALSLAPKWPVARGLNGSLTIDKRQLSATIYHGWLEDILLKSLNIGLSQLGTDKELLTMHTRINTASQKMINYLLQTPLQSSLGFLNKIQASGETKIDLQVEIPFDNDPEHIILLGDIQLVNTGLTIAFDGLPIAFSQVNGSMQFDKKGIIDSAFDMQFLTLPMAVRMHSNSEEKPALLIDADIPLQITALEQQWPSAWWRLLAGETRAHARMRVTEDPHDLDHLHIETKLKGIQLKLPPPFNKTAEKLSPVVLTVDFNSQQGFYLKTQWDDLLGTHLWFALDKGAIRLEKGEIRLGTARAATHIEHGVQLVGRLSEFDDRQWQTISEIAFQQPTASSFWSNIDFVDVLIDKAHWFGQSLSDASIKAKRLVSRWDISLRERNIHGKLQWDPRKNAYGIHLNRLTLPASNEQRSSTHWPRLHPKDFPAINMTVDELYSGNRALGRLNLNGKPDNRQWLMQRLDLDSKDYRIRAKGRWKKTGSLDESSIDAGFTIDNLSSLLKRFQYPDMVQAKHGFVSFEGQWSGPIYDPKLASLKAAIEVDIKSGSINELSKDVREKIGLGKLLSIFSLQTIPRRLRLDFSDLSNKGYSFDSIKGNFRLEKGRLITKKAIMTGPVARVSMDGAINLKSVQCNLNVRIMPHITASLPVVATIAGGPVAGVAVWLVNKLISREMEKVTAYTYLVTGPLSQPKIEQGKITRAKKIRKRG